jgi:hypothetical protein
VALHHGKIGKPCHAMMDCKLGCKGLAMLVGLQPRLMGPSSAYVFMDQFLTTVQLPTLEMM